MFGEFLRQAMPMWAVGLSVLLLVVVIIAPILIIRKLNGLIQILTEREPDMVKPAKGIVVGLFQRTIVAVIGLMSLIIVWLFGNGLPVWVGIACVLLLASSVSRIRSGSASIRYLSPRAIATSVSAGIVEDVKWLRGE